MARPIVGVAAVVVVLLAASSCVDGREFHVGGRAGWAPNPSEPFNTWAERNRFQVNDTLVFRYDKDADAVLVVTPSHYDACNATQPVLRLGGGHSRFVFDNSGPYFFISADAGRCKAGERLIVVVLAVRGNANNDTPSPWLSPPPPVAAPAPRALPPPPKSSSSSPPSAATPARRASPPSPPSASGKSDTSPPLAPVSAAPAPAPAPGTNGTFSPPSRSSAVALRGGVLACLLIAGAAILV